MSSGPGVHDSPFPGESPAAGKPGAVSVVDSPHGLMLRGGAVGVGVELGGGVVVGRGVGVGVGLAIDLGAKVGSGEKMAEGWGVVTVSGSGAGALGRRGGTAGLGEGALLTGLGSGVRRGLGEAVADWNPAWPILGDAASPDGVLKIAGDTWESPLSLQAVVTSAAARTKDKKIMQATGRISTVTSHSTRPFGEPYLGRMGSRRIIWD